MTFSKKLDKLTTGKSRAELSRRAGLPVNAISDYVNKGYLPRLDTAVALARVLGVSLDWLSDDEQDFPPPPTPALSAQSTEELTHELGRRMRPVGIELLIHIHRAERIDWIEVAKALLAADVDASLPPKIRTAMELPPSLGFMATRQLRHFDPVMTPGEDAPRELLKEVKPDFEAGAIELWQWYQNLRYHRPGFLQVANLAALWTVPAEYRPEWFAENIAHEKSRAAAQLANLPPPAFSPPKRSRK